MGDTERIVAVGLLTERDLQTLGTGFNRSFPLRENEDRDFTDLLAAIDMADRQHRAGRDDKKR